ncbi:MAG: hypothetical protein ACD_71C00118G0002 [uncultured bacterium (gcode 4)]|uniref:Uncharacterized protein n=1 Tax=uncultured bacterium (gcode 4) TaxID=1234023 RepID=K2A393_9BACT|nr:MAG: hypothetical protein ACD_71C00118G0002 [uncultured bacterium (gcode 4)]
MNNFKESKDNLISRLLNFLFTSNLAVDDVIGKKYFTQLATGIFLLLIFLCVYYFDSHIFDNNNVGLINIFLAFIVIVWLSVCCIVWFISFIMWFLNLCLFYAKRAFLWFFFLVSVIFSIGLLYLIVISFIRHGLPTHQIGQRWWGPVGFLILLMLPILVAFISYRNLRKPDVSSRDILNAEISEE